LDIISSDISVVKPLDKVEADKLTAGKWRILYRPRFNAPYIPREPFVRLGTD
jgi:hypothetical protein